MSEYDENLAGSEFELTEEEKAQLALEEQQGLDDESGNDDVEVDEETLNKLLNGHQENNQVETENQDIGNEDTNQLKDDIHQEHNEQEQEDIIVREQVEKYETSLNDLQATIDEQEQKQKDILDNIDELGKSFDAGDIGQGEYNSRLKRLELELDASNKATVNAQNEFKSVDQKYQDFAYQNQQKYENLWKDEVKTFLQENPVYDTESPYRTRFDEIFKDFQEKNVFAGMSYKNIISTVQHRVEIELGQPEQVKQKEKSKTLPKRQNIDIPPSIHQMQAVEDNASGDEFASIDRLNGIDYEVALERLEKNNPEAYKRYLQQG